MPPKARLGARVISHARTRAGRVKAPETVADSLNVRFALIVALVLACGTTHGPGIGVDDYRGVLSTHFDDVPDQARICAVLSNRSTRTLSWARLRLSSFARSRDEKPAWKSIWIWRGHLSPGSSVAVLFPHAPPSGQIALSALGSGSGRAPTRGRILEEAPECSERSLATSLLAEANGRESAGIRLLPLLRRGPPQPQGDDDS